MENLESAIRWMQAAIDQTPWSKSGLLIATAAAILLAYPLGRLLKSNVIVVGLLIAAVGFALVFTLTPNAGQASNPGSCYVKFSQPTREDLVQPTDVSLNILLFLPTGFLIMLLRPWLAVIGVACLALIVPVAVEYVQLVQVELGRACSFLDIATNELGLIIGLGIGLLVRIVWEIVRAMSNRVRR